ncbi:DMT family transporter [Roseomonas harenae]|uniref:DMT family transporter n=1 Tax=Muricoccus harenae TaxID=2692566 RepID=UPI0013312946|nr:DMT family transporter [Roseomonas harenae]
MTSAAASPRLRGLVWALLAVTVAAAHPALTRLGVTQQAMTPLELATLRYGVAGVVLAPVLLHSAGRLTRRDWREGCILACCQGTPLAALIAMGLIYAPAAHGAALTLGLMPAITLLLGLIGGRHPARHAWAGAAVIAAGAILLTLLDLGAGGSALIGHGMFVVAAVMGGIYFMRLRGSGFSAMEGAAFVAVLSGLGGVVVLALTGGVSHFLRIAPETLMVQAVFQGLLVGVLTMVAMNRVIALLGSTEATVCLSLVPAMAALFAIPVLGEVPTVTEAIAIGAMVVGALLSSGRFTATGGPGFVRVNPIRCLRRLRAAVRSRSPILSRRDAPAG